MKEGLTNFQPAGRSGYWLSGCIFFSLGSACGLVIVAVILLGWGSRQMRSVAQAPIPSPTPAVSPTSTLMPSPTAAPPIILSPTLTPIPIATAEPTPLANPSLGLSVPAIVDQRPIPHQAETNLAALHSAWYPPRDFYDTEDRLGGRQLRGRTLPPVVYSVGSRRPIFVGGETVTIELLYSSQHALFWSDVNLNIEAEDLIPVANRLENELYGPLVNFLGVEPVGGIDGEERFHVIHLSYRSADELGYFDSSDQFPREIFKFSNEHDAIYLNMAELELGERGYYGTMVHELEHLLHWQSDPNETTWLDEGLAELMEVYFDLDTFLVTDYLDRPDIQLNSWGSEPETTFAHYGGAGLFMIYFWEQLGDAAVRDLFLHPADGLASVRAVLAHYRPNSSLEQFMSEFYAAIYIQGEGPLGYRYWLPDRPQVARLKEPQEVQKKLPQFGVEYYEFDMEGEVTISFAGDTRVELFQPLPSSMGTTWLAPAVNSLDATLTAPFDLRGLSTATLTYNVWFELEPDYDFGYVLISTDEGATWRPLRPVNGQNGPFGSGYNGRSVSLTPTASGWLQETISLNEYIGQEIVIRFELLTDAAVADRGLALNHMQVLELGPVPDDHWRAEGFVKTGPWLAQQWSIQLLRPGTSQPAVLLPLDDFNQGRWRLILDEPAVLAVIPITPMTTQEADYWVRVER